MSVALVISYSQRLTNTSTNVIVKGIVKDNRLAGCITPCRFLPPSQFQPPQAEVNFTLEHIMMTQDAIVVYPYSFFNLGARCEWVVQATSRAPFSPGMTLDSYTIQGGLQGLSGRVRKIFNSTGIRGQGRQARSKLPYRLRYPCPQFQA